MRPPRSSGSDEAPDPPVSAGEADEYSDIDLIFPELELALARELGIRHDPFA